MALGHIRVNCGPCTESARDAVYASSLKDIAEITYPYYIKPLPRPGQACTQSFISHIRLGDFNLSLTVPVPADGWVRRSGTTIIGMRKPTCSKEKPVTTWTSTVLPCTQRNVPFEEISVGNFVLVHTQSHQQTWSQLKVGSHPRHFSSITGQFSLCEQRDIGAGFSYSMLVYL